MANYIDSIISRSEGKSPVWAFLPEIIVAALWTAGLLAFNVVALVIL